MSKLSRRSFLFACSCTAIAVALPPPALAAPASTIVLEAYESVTGSGKFDRVKVPSDLASTVGKARAASLEAASNRALKIAQSQNLSLPKANGLLTRLWRPSLRSMAKGVGPALLEAGLVVGLTIALSNATIELGKDVSNLTMSSSQCAGMTQLPSSITSAQTGMYRNSAGTAGSAIQHTTVQSTSSGTMPAPSGWSWSYQRQVGSSVFNSAGQRVYTWEVWFTKNIACGERVAFPPTTDPAGSIPNSGDEANQTDQNSDSNRVKVVDGLHNWAKSEQPTKPMPGGEIPGQVEEPGIDIPAPGNLGPPVIKVPLPLTPGDLTTPTPSPVVDPENTHVKFPPSVNLPADSGGQTPGGEEPGGNSSAPIDWGTPPTGEMPGAPTPFAWVPTPWTAPDLPGSCTGVPYDFAAIGASGTINPCPVIAQARPVVRPVAILGWTVYAIAQFLDL